MWSLLFSAVGILLALGLLLAVTEWLYIKNWIGSQKDALDEDMF